MGSLHCVLIDTLALFRNMKLFLALASLSAALVAAEDGACFSHVNDKCEAPGDDWVSGSCNSVHGGFKGNSDNLHRIIVDEALRMALKMEKDVTGAMKNMIDICSSAGQDDPHAADWLTGTWLEEQLQGQRTLAGLINTFNNFKRGHEELAEWMFDMEL